MIHIENVKKIYNAKGVEYTALDGVTLDINGGELVAITGKSGAGKSTLLHLIAGIDDVTEGKIVINGTDIGNISESKLANFRKNNIGIILQDFALIEDFSIIDNVTIPLADSKMSRKTKKDKCQSILEKLDIKNLIDKQVNKLSGGEKQRVAVARALIANPPILLADEPTGSLDNKNSQQIIDILKGINKDGKTVIIVTHDRDIATQCNRVIEISDGKIIRS